MIEILKSLAARPTDSRWGIGTAAVYLRQVEKSLQIAGPSAVKAFDLGSLEAWDLMVKEAGERLTWCDPEMLVLEKSLNEPMGGEDGKFILTFDAILSSGRKDRDGDIISIKGLSIDPNASLLWNHVPVQPYGRLLKVLEQTDDLVKCKFGIVDTALGRDAAILTKGGCLRMSHGFRAKEAEPLAFVTNKNGDKVCDEKGNPIVRGWHIKSAETFEASQVAIPANSDARVVEVYEKGAFRSVLVKSWAKSMFDSRPAQVAGVDLNELAVKGALSAVENRLKAAITGGAITANEANEIVRQVEDVKAGRRLSAASRTQLQAIRDSIDAFMADDNESPADKDNPENKTEGGRQGANPEVTGEANPNITTGVASSGLTLFRKDFNAEAFKSLYGAMESMEMPGSVEWYQEQLGRQAKSYLVEKGKLTRGDDAWTDIVATFPDHVYICARKWNRDGSGYDSRTVYKVSWEATAQTKGRAQFTGDPTQVEIRVGVIEQAIAKSLAGISDRDLANGLAARVLAGTVPAESVKSVSDALDLAPQYEFASEFLK